MSLMKHLELQFFFFPIFFRLPTHATKAEFFTGTRTIAPCFTYATQVPILTDFNAQPALCSTYLCMLAITKIWLWIVDL